jgi:hypothetical protein
VGLGVAVHRGITRGEGGVGSTFTLTSFLVVLDLCSNVAMDEQILFTSIMFIICNISYGT